MKTVVLLRDSVGSAQGERNGCLAVVEALEKIVPLQRVLAPRCCDAGKPELLDLLASQAVFSALEELRPDAVLYNDAGFAPLLSQLPYKSVLLVHLRPAFIPALRPFYGFVSSAIVALPEIARELADLRVPYVNTVPFPFDSSSLRNEKPRVPRVVWVGRNDDSKNPQRLFSIARLIPETPFVAFFGDGDVPEGLPGNVTVRRFEPRSSVRKEMSRASVFLSTSAFETFPIAPLEAGLSGCWTLAPAGSPGFDHLNAVCYRYASDHNAAAFIKSALLTPRPDQPEWDQYRFERLAPTWRFTLESFV